MKPLIRRILCALALLSVGIAPTFAQCYVNQAASGANDGASWAGAYTDLQAALANAMCTEIWVAKGVYKPAAAGTLGVSFDIRPGVAVYGGFSGTETSLGQRDPAANVTILSGDIDGNDTNTDGNSIDETSAEIVGSNSYHVVVMDGTTGTPITATTTLDGFTITAGNAQGSNFPDNAGGGLYCNGGGSGHACSPALANVTFSGNSANTSGGAMINYGYSGTSSPQLTNVTFNGNGASYGGAMFNDGYSGTSSPKLTNVTFSGNSANTEGGAMYNHGYSGTSSPTLANVTFGGNSAGYGGAMYNDGSYGGTSSPTLANITFSDNRADTAGGGAMFDDGLSGSSSPQLSSVTFNGNSANTDGGAMYNDGETNGTSSPALANVTFSSNSANTDGGAMFNNGAGGISSPQLGNITFSGNRATIGGAMYNDGETNGTSSPQLTKVTFNGNSADIGGAIYNDGYSGTSSPALANVTFSSNSANTDGGAMYNDGYRGTSSPTLANVTVSGNSADIGGAMYNDGSQGTSSPMLANVILWGDTARIDPEIYNISATPSIDHSVVQSGCPSGATCTNLITADPLLGTLANNGGQTQTMLPGAGSSAINAGDDTACAAAPVNGLDQRGVTRPQGSHCDIGAVEVDTIFANGFEVP